MFVKAKLKNDLKELRNFERKQNREMGMLAARAARDARENRKLEVEPTVAEQETIFTWFVERQTGCKGKKVIWSQVLAAVDAKTIVLDLRTENDSDSKNKITEAQNKLDSKVPKRALGKEVLPAPEEKKRGQKKPERMVKLLTTSNEANQKSCYKEANIPDDTSSASEGM